MSTELGSDNGHDSADALQLGSIEARILGCLIEKQATTPDTYPLTLNALVSACNQKTSREPVMNLTPAQVGQSLRTLEGLQLTRLVMGSRADRWEHRVDKTLELVPGQVVLLALLLLRGPQTVTELWTHSHRMHDFDDNDAVTHQLERLISRDLAILVPKHSGQREDRYLHALSSAEERETLLAARPQTAERSNGGSAALAERVETLEARIAALEERLAKLEE